MCLLRLRLRLSAEPVCGRTAMTAGPGAIARAAQVRGAAGERLGAAGGARALRAPRWGSAVARGGLGEAAERAAAAAAAAAVAAAAAASGNRRLQPRPDRQRACCPTPPGCVGQHVCDGPAPPRWAGAAEPAPTPPRRAQHQLRRTVGHSRSSSESGFRVQALGESEDGASGKQLRDLKRCVVRERGRDEESSPVSLRRPGRWPTQPNP
jgi:hypothetical protein